MGLTLANVGFVGAGVLLYVLARRRLFRRPSDRARRGELLASLVVGALVVVGFGLAHVGMNAAWTGRVHVSDFVWLAYGVVVLGALLEAHVLLRLQRSRADELVLPVAAFLASLGLVNVYVWEVRDANAYVSTVALPALRDYQSSLVEDRSLRPTRRVEIQYALGDIPNELDFETASRSATVLDGDWLRAYNRAARRFDRARALDPRPRADLPVREVSLDGKVRTQLVAAVLGLLSVPLVLFVLSHVRFQRLAGTALPLYAATALLIGIVVAALATSRSRDVPALLDVGTHSITIIELLKLGLVVLLALALARTARGRSARIAFAAAGFGVLAMIWRDLGAGIALLAVTAMMLSLVVGRRWRRRLVLAAVASVCVVPIIASVLDSHLPQTARIRLEMWSDPWGAFERAELENTVAGSLHRIARYRERGAETEHALGAAAPPGLGTPLSADVRRLESELRWRLQAKQLREGEEQPLVPGADPVETLLLRDAESLWTDLGGYRAASISRSGRSALNARVDDAIERLKAGAEDGGRSAGGAVAPDNFQLQRSLYALRAGGALGVGLGRGRPEMIPGMTEDVPLASIGEALGVGGVLLVSLLVLLLAGRGVELSRRLQSPTLALIASGLSVLLALQALISLAGLTGLLPFTGLTFPFVSRSGTAVVAGFLALALLMAVGTAPMQTRAERTARGGRAAALLGGAGFPAAFALVLGGLVLFQMTGRMVTSGPFLSALPGPAAAFLHAPDQWDVPGYRTAPGPILDRKGRVLAKTTTLGGGRVYPDVKVATGLGHTLLQLDLSFRDELIRPEQPRRVGPALVTTIDADVQRSLGLALDHGAVAAGLPDARKLRGAAVLIDVQDGGLVALESRPAFSLAELSDPVAWAKAEARERRAGFPYRYLNRVIHGFYPPGSIFKTVTAAAALERGFHTLYSRDFDYRHGHTGRREADGIDHLGAWHELPLEDGPPITDGNHPHLDEWHLNLAEAFAWSCNVAFAELGLKLGAADLVGFARRFGFERPLGVSGLGSTISTLDSAWNREPAVRFLAQTDWNLAQTAFGQGQAQVTPLQMVLVPAAIANGGKIMQPHVVSGWSSHAGGVRRNPPRLFMDTGFSDITIAELRRMMRTSVTHGWASTAQVNPNNAHPGVAGKTGSAEWSDAELDASHAWFIGYFPAERPRLALAVVVERGGAGPTVAARIARRIFAADAVQDYATQDGVR